MAQIFVPHSARPCPGLSENYTVDRDEGRE